MCLKAQPVPPIPEQTRQVAEAAFPKGNRCLRIRQVFDGIYKDDEFQAYYPLKVNLPTAHGAWL